MCTVKQFATRTWWHQLGLDQSGLNFGFGLPRCYIFAPAKFQTGAIKHSLSTAWSI
jgi:hypothetical protein